MSNITQCRQPTCYHLVMPLRSSLLKHRKEPQDWICPSCDAQISASEDKCFCGAVRPSPETIKFADVAKDPPKFAIGFGKVVVRLGAAAWFGFLCLWMQFAVTRPSSSSPDRLYALNTHGSVAYLTHKEEMLLYCLGTVAVGLIVIGAITGVALRQRYGRWTSF
jgi:hypothetical protein